jgi:tRNA(Ile)-lysidine synthase
MLQYPDGAIGIAVSGGSDSMALLVLSAAWARENNRSIAVVTVNHGLRAEAGEEAASVAQLCQDMGLAHDILHWQDWDGSGNLQNAARDARKALISRWAQQRGIETVLTGHTKDDQAETFLMRLARGSGVDGLAAIHPVQRADSLVWMRPLLSVGRRELRHLLREKGLSWAEDPSNNDRRFTRVRFRQAQAQLAELGLDVDVLAQTAERLQSARHALEIATQALAHQIAMPRESGSIRLQIAPLRTAPAELQYRLVAHCLRWVASTPYRPRFDSLKHLIDGILTGRKQSLSGCLIAPVNDLTIEISREAHAMPVSCDLTQIYDNRWRIICKSPPYSPKIRPLGTDGILQRPDWRQSAESRNTILSSPSIWCNNELMSVPLLDKDQSCTCRLVTGVEPFFSSILTH